MPHTDRSRATQGDVLVQFLALYGYSMPHGRKVTDLPEKGAEEAQEQKPAQAQHPVIEGLREKLREYLGPEPTYANVTKLAQKAQVSPSTLYKLLGGRRINPRLSTIGRIRAALISRK